MSSEEEFRKIMEKEVYDMAASTGSALRGVNKTQVSQLIEVFQTEGSPIDGCKLLILHVARQVARGEIRRDAGSKLIQNVCLLLTKLESNAEWLRQAMLKYLTLTKWVFECEPEKPVSNFDELVKLELARRPFARGR